MARGHVIPFAEARRLKSGNPQARWASVAADFAGDVWPEIKPSFSIQRGDTGGQCEVDLRAHLLLLPKSPERIATGALRQAQYQGSVQLGEAAGSPNMAPMPLALAIQAIEA